MYNKQKFVRLFQMFYNNIPKINQSTEKGRKLHLQIFYFTLILEEYFNLEIFLNTRVYFFFPRQNYQT